MTMVFAILKVQILLPRTLSIHILLYIYCNYANTFLSLICIIPKLITFPFGSLATFPIDLSTSIFHSNLLIIEIKDSSHLTLSTFLTTKGFDDVFAKNAPKLPFLVHLPNFRKKTVLGHI